MWSNVFAWVLFACLSHGRRLQASFDVDPAEESEESLEDVEVLLPGHSQDAEAYPSRSRAGLFPAGNPDALFKPSSAGRRFPASNPSAANLRPAVLARPHSFSRSRGLAKPVTNMMATASKGKKAVKYSEDMQAEWSKAANGKTLVIVESPTKAKTIQKFLADADMSNYVVDFSAGHVRDLSKESSAAPEGWKTKVVLENPKLTAAALGVDVHDKFEPFYQIMPDKKRSDESIKEACKRLFQDPSGD